MTNQLTFLMRIRVNVYLSYARWIKKSLSIYISIMLCGESIYFPYEFKYVLLIYVGRLKNLSICIYFFMTNQLSFLTQTPLHFILLK